MGEGIIPYIVPGILILGVGTLMAYFKTKQTNEVPLSQLFFL